MNCLLIEFHLFNAEELFVFQNCVAYWTVPNIFIEMFKQEQMKMCPEG